MWSCCCGGSCTIGTDPFTEADNSVVPGWTQVAGTSAIVSNKLKMTANNTLVIFNTADSAGGVEVVAQVDCSGANSDDVIRLIVKEKDATNSDSYLVEFIVGTSKTLRLFSRIAGVETQLVTKTITTTAGTTYTLRISYGNGSIVGTVVGVDSVFIAGSYTNSTQLNAGLACGAITSNVLFANFLYNHDYNSGAHATCDNCVTGTWQGFGTLDGAPIDPTFYLNITQVATVDVNITSVANRDCATCNYFNADYSLSLNPYNTPDGCKRNWKFFDPTGSCTQINLAVYADIGAYKGSYFWFVSISSGGFSSLAITYKADNALVATAGVYTPSGTFSLTKLGEGGQTKCTWPATQSMTVT